MPKVVSTIEVPGKAETIFDFLADYRNITRLQSQFESARVVSDNERGLGAIVELQGRFHGVPMRVQNRIVTFASPSRLVSISEGAILSRNTWELRPLSGDGDQPATEVTFSVEYKISGPFGGIFTGIASSLFHGEIEAMTHESLKRLRASFSERE
jgi:ribosome-associated toxin RatA of RatAB toxin-antitoxin module